MKKRRTLLWVLFFVLLSLAGCAGAEPEKEMAAESAAGERKADHSGLQEKLEQRLSSYEKEHPGDVVWPLSGEPVHWPFAGTTLRNWDDSCEVYGILSKRLKITLETGTGTVTAEGREEDREWLRGELGQIPVNAEETAAFGQLSEEQLRQWELFLERIREAEEREDCSVLWILGINQLRLTTRDAGEIIIYLPVPEGEQLVIRSLRYFPGQKEWLEKRLEGSGILCEENPVTETEPGTIHPQEAKEQNPPENREVTVSYLERQGDREILSVENRGADKAVKSIAAEQYREGRWVKALPRDSGAEELLTYLYLEPGDRVWELHTGELLLEEEQKTRFIFYFEDGTAAWAEW